MSPAPRRVLLVDDEQKIVDGLQRLLRPHRASWEVVTATSPTAALAMMIATPFDVVVSDMRMPEMDGAALLAAAKEKCPGTARIILSGQTGADAALRTVGVAHQFLSKPTEGATLLAALNRVVQARDRIRSPAVLDAIGRIDALPSAPALCQHLTTLVSGDDLTVSALVAELEREPAVILKILQLVNSAFFGLRREMTNIAQAVAYLGTELCKNLVISLSITSAMPVRAREFSAEAFQGQAVRVGQLARYIGGAGEVGDTAFLAGMLLDVGKLTLAFAMPELYDEVAARARVSGRSFEEEEAAAGTCGHRTIAAYLINLWGLPAKVVLAVVEHRGVLTQGNTAVTPGDALYIALRLLESDGSLDDDAHRAYLARIGAAHRLPEMVARSRQLSAA